jgi:hypothetical protein
MITRNSWSSAKDREQADGELRLISANLESDLTLAVKQARGFPKLKKRSNNIT